MGVFPSLWRVWAIDDSLDNLRMIEASLFPIGAPFLILEPFEDAAVALNEFERRHSEGGATPDIILMDYFLGGVYGSAVTEQIRALHAPQAGPIIIGHSSLAEASEAIVRAGGDFILPKRPGQPFSAPLRAALGSAANLESMIRTRRHP